MPGTETSLSVRRAGAQAAIITVRGELTGATDRDLMEAYHKASDASTTTVIFDFTDLDYMNSTGIGLLVTLLVRAQRQRQRLMAFGLSTHYREILSLTRLDEAIGIVGSEAEAIAGA